MKGEGDRGKLLQKSINGPYSFEREIIINLSRLEKKDAINGLSNDTKRYKMCFISN